MRRVLHNITVAFFAIIVLVIILLVGLWYWLDPVNRDSPITLGGNYVYVDGDICMTDDDGSLHLVIPDDVRNYMYDENYIIAYQRPSLVRADYFWSFDNTVDKDSIKSLKNLCYRLKDCYWIICKDNDSVLGPMSYNDYKQKCKKLDVKIKLLSKHQK
jgi:hypothetical protein